MLRRIVFYVQHGYHYFLTQYCGLFKAKIHCLFNPHHFNIDAYLPHSDDADKTLQAIYYYCTSKGLTPN